MAEFSGNIRLMLIFVDESPKKPRAYSYYKMKKPLILITNDDSIHAPGLRALINMMKDRGSILVVAPDRPQSGMGHAITTQVPLRIRKSIHNGEHVEYATNGTPVDCIKVADYILKGEKPDLIVSGINHGSNASINIIYSGTMAAVMEGVTLNIPSVGFSVNEFSHHIDLSFSEKYIKEIIDKVLTSGLPPHTGLNVNIPYHPGIKIKGIKVCRQARAYWNETLEEKTDPHGRPYYWLNGNYCLTDEKKDTDQWALQHNYIAVVPVKVDFTSYETIPIIKKWKFHV